MEHIPAIELRVFATMNAASGVAQLLVALIGGALVELRGFRLLLAVTLGTRLAIAGLAAAPLPAAAPHRRVLLRLAGVRWAGGLRHEPIQEAPAQDNRGQTGTYGFWQR